MADHAVFDLTAVRLRTSSIVTHYTLAPNPELLASPWPRRFCLEGQWLRRVKADAMVST
jgi:hypothetical protein